MRKLVFEFDERVDFAQVCMGGAVWGKARKISWVEPDGHIIVLKDTLSVKQEEQKDGR